MHTEIWAHRGSSHTFIENTLAAFNQAIKDGADGVELDVQRTLDNELVVIHDEHLKRLTGENYFLWELSWDELKKLELSSTVVKTNKPNSFNASVPKLEDVLELLKEHNLKINIELKNTINFYPGMEKEIVDCVNKVGVQEQVIYSSFNHASINLIASLVGSKHCGILTSDIQHEPWNYLKNIEVMAYHPMINSLQQKHLVEGCHKHGVDVRVWTPDEEAYIYASLLSGVDAIITNEPTKAIQLKEQMADDGGKQAMESVKALGLPIIE